MYNPYAYDAWMPTNNPIGNVPANQWNMPYGQMAPPPMNPYAQQPLPPMNPYGQPAFNPYQNYQPYGQPMQRNQRTPTFNDSTMYDAMAPQMNRNVAPYASQAASLGRNALPYGSLNSAGYGLANTLGRYGGSTAPSLLSSLTKAGGGFSWSGLLSGTQKTLATVNQIIPLIYQAQPIINNVRTIMRVAKEVKSPSSSFQQAFMDEPTTNTNTVEVEETAPSRPTFFD